MIMNLSTPHLRDGVYKFSLYDNNQLKYILLEREYIKFQFIIIEDLFTSRLHGGMYKFWMNQAHTVMSWARDLLRDAAYSLYPSHF